MNAVTASQGDIIAHYQAEHGRLQAASEAVSQPGQPDWLRDIRGRALARFTESGFPTPRNEDWKYTRVSAIEKRAFACAPHGAEPTADTAADADAQRTVQGEGSVTLVFVDGQLHPELSRTQAVDAEVRITALNEALTSGADWLKEQLAARCENLPNGFSALNCAFSGAGVVIEVPAGCKASSPIELLFLNGAQDSETANHPQIWITLGAEAQLTVVETFAAVTPGSSRSGETATLTNAATVVNLDRGARLTHVKVQDESPVTGYHVASLDAELAAGAQLESLSISLGARLARNDINIALRGEGARVGLDGLMLAKGRQHTDFHTRVDHLVPGALSDEYYKGIFDERSRGVFNGRVYVHPGADQTEAYQQNRNLLLSRNAEVDTKPQLEIYADEVKCSHGATVGQLDEAMLFYLRSRGLTEQAATGMLLGGFIKEVIDRLEDPQLRGDVLRKVMNTLPGLPDSEEMGE